MSRQIGFRHSEETKRKMSITKQKICLEDRFWSKVDIKDDNTCWKWTGSTNDSGYGLFGIKGKTWKSHRLSWVLTYGLSQKTSAFCIIAIILPAVILLTYFLERKKIMC